jgi:hypothetical protein
LGNRFALGIVPKDGKLRATHLKDVRRGFITVG